MILEYNDNGKTIYILELSEQGTITVEREFDTYEEARTERDRYFSDETYFN